MPDVCDSHTEKHNILHILHKHCIVTVYLPRANFEVPSGEHTKSNGIHHLIFNGKIHEISTGPWLPLLFVGSPEGILSVSTYATDLVEL